MLIMNIHVAEIEEGVAVEARKDIEVTDPEVEVATDALRHQEIITKAREVIGVTEVLLEQGLLDVLMTE